MPLQFIDNANIDTKARRLIRSQAATGKNGGKIRSLRRKESRLGAKTPAPIYSHHSEVVDDAIIPESRSNEAIEIERQLGDGFSVLSLPTKLNATSKVLFTNAFSFLKGPFNVPELCSVVNFQPVGAKQLWIQSVFLDEAYLHCVISMFVTVVKPTFIKQGDSIEAMHHLSETFRLLNKKLSGREALSDITMVVAIAMTQYERLRGQCKQGLVHFNGLLRIIELRGGISQLVNRKPGLAQKVLRADLEFALHLGLATHYKIENLPSNTPVTWLRNMFEQNHKQQALDTVLFRELNADLQDVLINVTSLAWLLNGSATPGIQLDSYTFHDTLISIGYHLIQISSIAEPRPMSHLETILHLGLVAFLTTLLPGVGSIQQEYPLLSEFARSAFQKQDEKNKESQELFLWTLVIGMATIFGSEDDSWLVPKLTKTTTFLGLWTLENMRRTLSKFPWIDAVHDKTSQVLWYKIVPLQTQPRYKTIHDA